MEDEWRSLEVLKLLRQCAVCPYCGVLVATQAGIDAHVEWHNNLKDYVDNVNHQLEQFSDYVVNPTTGLQKRIQDRLDTITNYVTAPTTGLEARTVKAFTDTNAAVAQLRSDATGAITALNQRVATVELRIGP